MKTSRASSNRHRPHRHSRALTRIFLVSFFAAASALSLWGCDDPSGSPVDPSALVEPRKHAEPPVVPPPYQHMSFAVWRVDRPYQSHYGPAAAGYRGTGYFADDAMPDAQATWTDIRSAGYTTKWMAVRRDWLTATPVDWTLIDAEISFAVANDVDYISVDDAMSPYSYGGAVITDETMLAFGHHVHLRGKKVAAADNDNIRDLLDAHPHFFDSVDVFMPYGYNRNLTQLQEYFIWVHAHLRGKDIVPILGYHVWDVNPPYRILRDQLGVESGHAGFIELAQSFAALNADVRTRMVMYYYEPDSPWPASFDAAGGLKTYLDALTSYLHQYKYVPSPAGPA